MRYGFWMPVFGGWLRNVDDEGMEASWAYTKKLAQRAEQLGYDLSLIAELNLNDIKGVEAPSLDAWSTAAALAAVTERLELMVAVRPTFHNPALLAKQAANIDRISNGRLTLNVVSSWWADEATKYGIQFDQHEDRYARASEWLDVLDGCWAGSNEPGQGFSYVVAQARSSAASHAVRGRRVGDGKKPDRGQMRRVPHAWRLSRDSGPQDCRYARASRPRRVGPDGIRSRRLRHRA